MPNYGAIAGALGAANTGITEGFNIYQGLQNRKLAEREMQLKEAAEARAAKDWQALQPTREAMRIEGEARQMEAGNVRSLMQQEKELMGKRDAMESMFGQSLQHLTMTEALGDKLIKGDPEGLEIAIQGGVLPEGTKYVPTADNKIAIEIPRGNSEIPGSPQTGKLVITPDLLETYLKATQASKSVFADHFSQVDRQLENLKKERERLVTQHREEVGPVESRLKEIREKELPAAQRRLSDIVAMGAGKELSEERQKLTDMSALYKAVGMKVQSDKLDIAQQQLTETQKSNYQNMQKANKDDLDKALSKGNKPAEAANARYQMIKTALDYDKEEDAAKGIKALLTGSETSFHGYFKKIDPVTLPYIKAALNEYVGYEPTDKEIQKLWETYKAHPQTVIDAENLETMLKGGMPKTSGTTGLTGKTDRVKVTDNTTGESRMVSRIAADAMQAQYGDQITVE